jgi:hypothetical protein
MCTPNVLRGQTHGHLNVGAVGTNQNDALFFANGVDFAPDSAYVKTLLYTNAGRYADYHQGNITLTALAQTAEHAGPEPGAPALGSLIQASIVSVEGPTGGQFSFWENGATTPTYSIRVGETATNLWRLSENDGVPSTDPFGHIHGRRLTATKPGIYRVGFQAFDTSTNGVGGQPIHSPSEVLTVAFQAGIHVETVEPDDQEGHVHIYFGAMAGFTWQVEASTNVGPAAVWFSAGDPQIGTDTFTELLHDVPPGDRRFYRVKGVEIVP